MFRWQSLTSYFHASTTAVLLVATGTQAVTFVLLARGLGAEIFGKLMVIQASAQLALELVSLGSGDVLMRRVSRSKDEFTGALGHALLMTAVTGFLVVIALSLVAFSVNQAISASAAFVFFSGELLGGRLSGLTEHAFLAHSRINDANAAAIFSATIKLAAVLIGVYLFGIHDLAAWLMLQGSTTLLAGFLCLLATITRLGAPRWTLFRADLGFGVLMSFMQLSRSAQSSIDRLVLGTLAPPALVGLYSAAVRSIQLAAIPNQAIRRNLLPQFYAIGHQGIGPVQQMLKAQLVKIILTGLIGSAFLLLFADIFARILGQGYEDTAFIIRWLSPIPALQGIQFFLGDALSSTGRQGWRTSINVSSTVIFAGALGMLASYYGIPGILAAIYANQVLIIILYLSIIVSANHNSSVVKNSEVSAPVG